MSRCGQGCNALLDVSAEQLPNINYEPSHCFDISHPSRFRGLQHHEQRALQTGG